MASCDLCGKNADYLDDAIVEGSMVKVCQGCKKFGKVVSVAKPLIKDEPRKTFNVQGLREEEFISQDYSEKIKNSREALNMTQEQLAKELGEKLSTVHKLEIGHMTPSIKLAKKIEQFFRIKLTYKQMPEQAKKLDLKNNSLTIGDLLKIKKNE